MFLTSVPSLSHTWPGHPENAARVPAILKVIQSSVISHQCFSVEPRPATMEELTRVHPRDFVEALERVMAQAPGYVDHAPTYITPESFECARLAAGAACAVVEQSLIPNPSPPEGLGIRDYSAFALIRPPGHHATPTQAMGFCLFNNIAIAARHAQALGARKVMIVDFDVHHGNGTQAAFYEDDSVLFVSTHQDGIYPMSGEVEETGEEAGRGYTVNVPLPAGAGDAAAEGIMAEIIRPLADRFQPNMLLVSAGYDAHWKDPLAALQFTCTGYYRMVHALREIALQHCVGRIVCVLEGGYDLDALAHSALASVHALLGHDSAPDPLGPAPYREPDVSALIAQVRALHGL
ncbi:MAG: histone deacetylase family protein [Anaerolineales bacterium]